MAAGVKLDLCAGQPRHEGESHAFARNKIILKRKAVLGFETYHMTKAFGNAEDSPKMNASDIMHSTLKTSVAFVVEQP
jgi:hypothetical protein